MSEFKFPTETIKLPSKGLVYSEDNPLSSGEVEMKYMTAREEDILTNSNYIQDGTVIDRVLQSLIVSKIDYDDLIIGDKNALLVASRILGYGKDYTFNHIGKEYTIDLNTLEHNEIDESVFTQGKNEFEYTFPTTGNKITFKLLTSKDEKDIQLEINGLKKINPEANPEISTRLKYIIKSVEGDSNPSVVREFVDNYLLARDSREFRNYIAKFQPDIDLSFTPEGGGAKVAIPVGLSFFWPDF